MLHLLGKVSSMEDIKSIMCGINFGCVLTRSVTNLQREAEVRSNTVEPPNNGHIGDEHFVHCLEVIPSSGVEMYGQYLGRG